MIDSNDKAGIIVIITAVGISWTSLTLIVRLVSKLQQKSIIGLEELLVIIASVCTEPLTQRDPILTAACQCLAFISSACILGAVGHGLGKRTTEVESDEHESALKVRRKIDEIVAQADGCVARMGVGHLLLVHPGSRERSCTALVIAVNSNEESRLRLLRLGWTDWLLGLCIHYHGCNPLPCISSME